MLHVAQAHGSITGPHAMRLHREHLERRERMSRAARPEPIAPTPEPAPLPEILVYPAYIFADDADRSIETVSPNRVREIQNLVCKNLEVLRSDLLSARRERSLVAARQIAMYLCKRYTPNSFPDIGRRFGGRDHTTVLSAVRRVAKMMVTPMGTSISPQWSVGACDFVRNAVNRAEMEISTWGEGRISRVRHPARSEG